MTEREALKPCPFCGAAPAHNDAYAWCFGPRDHNAHGLIQAPIAAWNRRTGGGDDSSPAGGECGAGAAALPAGHTAPSASDSDIVERLKIILHGAPLPLHWQKSHLSGKTVDLKREHWLIGSAATLQGLGLIFGDNDRLARLIVETVNALPALLEEIEEGREFFDVEWEANMRGIEMWRAANPGNDLVLPDQGHLVKWLLDTAALSQEGLVAGGDGKGGKP